MSKERSFTDEQITAVVAGLILALDKSPNYFGNGVSLAVGRAQDIMNVLRGEPTQEQRWRAGAEERDRRLLEARQRVLQTLATGRMHSTAR